MITKIFFCFHYHVNVGRILSSLRETSHEDPCEESQSKSAHLSQFLPTSRRIVQFSNGKVCIVYVLNIVSEEFSDKLLLIFHTYMTC